MPSSSLMLNNTEEAAHKEGAHKGLQTPVIPNIMAHSHLGTAVPTPISVSNV